MRGIALGLLLAPAVALGQVVVNKTGTNNPLAGPNYAITDSLGWYQGTNLFHSFSTFNLNSSETATFSGLAGTSNIIARVNGGAASNINGTLASSIAGANVWFLNPSGLVFGPNAQLNITGSFHASTAHVLKFGANGQFDMTNAPAGTLTVDPTAFGFLSAPKPIALNGSVLQVDAGKQVSLAGGNLTANGAVIFAPAGRINLASVASAGELSLDPGGLGATGVSSFGTMRLTNSAVFTEAGAQAPGPIYIRGGSLTLDNSAVSTLHSSAGAGADIDINLTGDFRLLGGPIGLVRASSTGLGDAGNVTLRARSVSLSRGAVIDTSGIDLNTFAGRGRAGQTTILATGGVSLSQGSALTSITFTGAQAGEMRIEGSSLTLSGGSVLQASTFGDGPAGQIAIEVGSLRLTGGSQIQAATIFNPALTPGIGPGGNVVVNATGGVSIAGTDAFGFPSGIFSLSTSNGDAGNITVSAGSIVLAGGATISSNSGFDLSTGGLGGNAGSINLVARTIRLVGGSSVSTAARIAGGGIVTITAGDYLALSDSRITTSVADGTGNGGDINIDPMFVVLDSSQIIAQAVGGNGGDINIGTQYFIRSSDSIVDASSQFALDGTVQITSPNMDPGSGLTVLPSAFFDPSHLLRASCATRGAQAGSTFIGAARGGLPAGPDSAAFASYGFQPAAQTAARGRRQETGCITS